MNKQQWITASTLTDNQRNFKAEYYSRYHSNRRKYNIVGGILSAIVTICIDIKVLHIDLKQPLTDTDKLYTAFVFIALMFVFRLFRQRLQSINVSELPYTEEEKQAISEMTPQQAMQYLKADEQYNKQCKTGKHTGNATAFILIIVVVVAYAYAVNKGVL